ncbi:ATP-binding cassette domain-containing protein [Antribacter sp. KLBMP9083]|uniref:ATP-binding cassette domain-containing protein n=1 Tax=Antribacter soli TaxID=2910976 RepID=A0AA41QHJ7_9MICO|nr:ATP-binding cassette domain-containing protein [Antribacter soli]MCF4123618.1 ATP-binding cassette domain-containing protein [Antribacter soli]
MDITLDVAPGEVVALLGPNGAGKSTLLQAVAGLLDPARGEVVVALGDRVLADTAAGVRVPARDRGVGWLGQRALLLDNLTVLDNVAFGPASRGTGGASARAAAARQLEAVGAEHVAGRHPRELSGGLAQRVAVARALATEPVVLLVDEPFAALDVDSVAQVRALLRATHDAAPRTTLLVTHDAADVAALADRVVVLDRGRVVEDGPVDRVLARPESPFARRLLSPSAPS